MQKPNKSKLCLDAWQSLPSGEYLLEQVAEKATRASGVFCCTQDAGNALRKVGVRPARFVKGAKGVSKKGVYHRPA